MDSNGNKKLETTPSSYSTDCQKVLQEKEKEGREPKNDDERTFHLKAVNNSEIAPLNEI